MPINSVIQSVGHVVPERVVTNAELAQKMSTSDQWIAERTGIRERRFVEPGTSASDLGLQASEIALKRAGREPSEIDMIVASTLSPDFYFPGIGVLLQNRMGIGTIPALDIRAQCSGFVYGLSVVDAFIRSGQAKRILFVCAEVQSPVLEMSDEGREMAVLFGDGAGALVIEAEESETRADVRNSQRGVVDSVIHSDGSGAELLMLRSPGTASKEFVTQAMLDENVFHPSMDGRTVFRHAVSRMCETAAELLQRHKLSPQDVSLLFPHQANLRINEMVREKLEIPKEKVFNTIHKYGNTTSATIPICLSEAEETGVLKRGDLIMSLAFGAGFTWGANLMRW